MELLSETRPKARKKHICIWCGEGIPVGLRHVHEVSRFEGDFQDHRFHEECLQACHEYCGTESEFMPAGYKRGTMEER